MSSATFRFLCVVCGNPAYMSGVENPYHDDPALDEEHTALEPEPSDQGVDA